MKKGDTVLAFNNEGTIVQMSAGGEHVKVRHNGLERWYWATSLRVLREAPAPQGSCMYVACPDLTVLPLGNPCPTCGRPVEAAH